MCGSLITLFITAITYSLHHSHTHRHTDTHTSTICGLPPYCVLVLSLTNYHYFLLLMTIPCLTLLECKSQKGKDFYLFCSLMNPKHQEEDLVYSRCYLNEYMTAPGMTWLLILIGYLVIPWIEANVFHHACITLLDSPLRG